ncbi:MAG: hypothetical protein K5873_10320 [Treponema sp.]|nr:hypothetical protein [Treponema sp.]
MKKIFLTLFTFVLTIFNSFAIDIVFRLSPGFFIPSKTNLDLGQGLNATAQLDADLFGFLTLGAEGIFSYSTVQAISENAFFYGGGMGLGAYYFPLSRLYLGLGAAGGIYQVTTTSSQNEKSTSNFYWRAYGELGFRFTPEFTLGASAGYTNFFMKDSKESAANLSLTARFTLPLGKGGSSSVLVFLEQDTPAYPMFMKAYRKVPLATLYLRNNEGAEIKNVHVSFRAGKYTASSYESAELSRISNYKTVEIPLYADFSKEVLRFVESGKIAGEIIIDYEFLGKKKHAVQNATISLYNSNAFLWGDYDALSAFISPDTPEILEYAKYVAGIARNSFSTGLNRNLQTAAAMAEALRLTGITYSADTISPYTEYHLSEKIDDVLYPLQTLNMGGGDYDDIGVLFASCLESVGVDSGYIVLDDDFIVLVGTGIKPASAGNHFADKSSLILDENNSYFGLSMKDFEKGFSKSRKTAAAKIKELNGDSENSHEYTIVHAAWQVYEPCAYSENGAHYDKPSSTAITEKYKAAIKDYMSSDLEKVLASVKKSGDHNKIGLALVRMGRYAEAKDEFAKDGSIKALNNIANICMIEKNYSAAASYYKKVLAKDPENHSAKTGLENANEKLMK